jgi:two-component sensor histidine kinase/PAS domain-containing protein
MKHPEAFTGQVAFLASDGAMAELIAAHDWASTSIGPIGAWPAALKTTISTILSSSLPMALLVGLDAIAIYNDAYAALIGVRHPGTLGSKARERWPELADLTDRAVTAARAGERFSFRDLELTVMRKGTPEQVWMNLDCSPVRDEDGAWLGVLSVSVETTERVLADRKAALEFDRLRNMFDQAPGFICLLGGAPDYVVEYVNEAHKQLFGDRKAEGRPYLEAFGDVAEAGKPEIIFEAFASGQRFIARGEPVLVPTPSGVCDERFLDIVVEPLKDEAAKVNRLYVEGFDVTPAVQAQRTAEETARRLSAAVMVARLGTFELAADGEEVRLDARAREIFAFAPDQRLTIHDLIGRIEAEDLHRMAQEDAAAAAAGQWRRVADYRIVLPDGSVRHITAVGDLMRRAQGPALWSVGMLEDVTERRRAEQRQRLLINELNHRVKNTLATVQSIASQTLRSASDLTQARASFEARLVALSAAHDLLTAQSWHGAPLDELVATALAPFEGAQAPQISRSGPRVWLSAPRALALSLAVHELATNAVKYGALAVPEGHLALRWTVHSGALTFSWVESGGAPVAPPVRSGFGMRLLQRNLARELGGEVVLDFAPAGVRCEIRFGVEEPEPAARNEAVPVSSEALGRFWEPKLDSELQAPASGPAAQSRA